MNWNKKKEILQNKCIIFHCLSIRMLGNSCFKLQKTTSYQIFCVFKLRLDRKLCPLYSLSLSFIWYFRNKKSFWTIHKEGDLFLIFEHIAVGKYVKILPSRFLAVHLTVSNAYWFLAAKNTFSAYHCHVFVTAIAECSSIFGLVEVCLHG